MEKLSTVGLFADNLDRDKAIISPCHHWETRVTMMDGVFVLHCDYSVLCGGDCKQLIALRVSTPDLLRALNKMEVNAEDEYQINLICANCNEDVPYEGRKRDVRIDFTKKTNRVIIRCIDCGNIISDVTLKEKVDIN